MTLGAKSAKLSLNRLEPFYRRWNSTFSTPLHQPWGTLPTTLITMSGRETTRTEAIPWNDCLEEKKARMDEIRAQRQLRMEKTARDTMESGGPHGPRDTFKVKVTRAWD